MAKMIVSFIALFVMVYFGIQLFTLMSGKEKFQLIKALSYTMFITAMVVLIVASIIVLF